MSVVSCIDAQKVDEANGMVGYFDSDGKQSCASEQQIDDRAASLLVQTKTIGAYFDIDDYLETPKLTNYSLNRQYTYLMSSTSITKYMTCASD